MKYIGIRGHKGAGKTTISYLLGNTLNYILEKSTDNFDVLYRTWCDDFIKDERIIHECQLEYIYFESFSDTLKLWVKLLIGCPSHWANDDYYKDHVIINLKDFSYIIHDEIPDNIKVYTHEELYEIMPKDRLPMTITKNIYIDLRNFIMYFGLEVMQRFFGSNVWVKSMKQSHEFYNSLFNDNDMIKLFIDVKTPGEVTYIRNNGGIIVKVIRPKCKKSSSKRDKLSQDNRFDYEVVIGDDLYETKDIVFEIANKIIKNGEEN